ncbi:MAG: hypothetical protein E7323_04540 [Clostridiales bacterium]|nr:hypothetical protein [Clostridiales bacterium]
MKGWQANRIIDRIRKTDVIYYCLLMVAVLDFLLIVFENRIDFVVNAWSLIPTVLFFGIAIVKTKTKTTKQLLILGSIMVLWFLIVQLIHQQQGLKVRPIGVFSSVYLLALPFASIAKDGESCKGLKLYMGFFFAGLIVILVLAGLLVIDQVPFFLKSDVFLYNSGISIMVHPSQLGGLLVAGIGFAFTAFSITKRMQIKVALVIMIILMFIVLALTKCNAAIWMAYLVSAGCVFVLINKGGYIRFIAGVMAAIIIIVVAFLINQLVFVWHWDMYKEKAETPSSQYHQIKVDEKQADRSLPDMFHQTVAGIGSICANRERYKAMQPVVARKASTSVSLLSTAKSLSAFQRQLWALPTLNGRIPIWISFLENISQNKTVLLFGLDYSMYTLESININHPHTHNSWLEALSALGVPGFLMIFGITTISIWHVIAILFGKCYEAWKKCVALLVVGLFGVGFMEPHLFLGGHFLPGGNNLHPMDFSFFLCLGHMIEWRRLNTEHKKTIK